MRKLLTSCLVVLICFTAFISGYSKGCSSYAEDINYMSDEELEAAYQAYLQSKGGGLIGNAGARIAYTNGKMLNFLTSEANTTPFKSLNDVKGLMNWQKTELESGNSSVLQLSMSEGGASVFSLYTQWLMQKHFFGNGVEENDNGMFDNGVNNNIFSGKLFTYNGVSVLAWTVTRAQYNRYYGWYSLGEGQTVDNTLYAITSRGSDLQTEQDIYNIWFNYENKTNSNYSASVPTIDGGYFGIAWGSGSWVNGTYARPIGFSSAPAEIPICLVNGNSPYNKVSSEFHGGVSVAYATDTNNFYNFIYSYNDDTNKYNGRVSNVIQNELTDDESDANIFFVTNVNNNITNFPDVNADGRLYITPQVDVGLNGQVDFQPYIINEGDNVTNVVNNYYIDSGKRNKTRTIPSTNPDDGTTGGGGGNDNPSGGTPPNWQFPHLTPDGEGGFNFNFTLPDLNIDWNISGLKDKFPFSIPFDLIHFVEVLNAQPETPEFDWVIDLRIYQWHIDADLHQFDNLAGIVRNVEFIGFCITLVMITRRMIKG